jgi:hypothetical protein
LRKAPILLVPALLAGTLLAGCGGDDSPSKADYVKDANAICKKTNDEINTAAKKEFGNQRPSQKQTTNFINETAIPGVEDELSQLRDLDAPSGDEDTVNAIYDAAEEGLNKAKQDPSLLVQNNPPAFDKANKLAKDYGLTVCAS